MYKVSLNNYAMNYQDRYMVHEVMKITMNSVEIPSEILVCIYIYLVEAEVTVWFLMAIDVFFSVSPVVVGKE